jgi:hypothetical protein
MTHILFRPSSWNHSSQWRLNSDNNQLNLVILGIDGLAEELASEIQVCMYFTTFPPA